MPAKSEMPEPFALWDSARRKLDDAIQLYLDTSTAFAAAVSQSPHLFSDQDSFENAINTV